MRRTLIIAAVVIVLLGAGAAIYFSFFSGSSAGVAVTTPSGNTSLPSAGQGAVPATDTTTSTGGTSNTPTGSLSAPVAVSSRLMKISAGPVVPGEAVITKAATASSSPETTVSYIDRQSGNIFSYSTLTKQNTRTSNKTIPGIQSASWLPNGSVAFVRYLSGNDFSTINTYALPANGSSGFFLAQNLADVSVSASGVLTLASGVNGSTASLSRTDGTRAASAFSSPLSSLRASFAGKQYLATTKAAASLSGSAFLVDAAGHFSRVAGPLTGLVAHASPSGKWVLASYTNNAALQTQLVNVATGETIPLPVATIADKCVWASDDSAIYCGIPADPPANASYPDDWYQGAVHFSDRIWKIQVAGRYAQLVLDFTKETKDSLDATALAIDASNTTLVFVNKNDGSLWSYSL
ncbi:MAG: hypothetical protein PHD04_00785 [Candidatus Pacebacteria bacterium]|nr:hypothetical protein [Candidatus Paceibacterota bacterium]